MIWDKQRWPNFSEEELRCKCGCGRADMRPEFLDRLQDVRTAYGKPLTISSGFRCPDHNSKASHTGFGGPHTTGRAVDIAIRGHDAHALLSLALSHGFTGIGVSQKDASRFLHLDDLEDAASCPRPWIWSY